MHLKRCDLCGIITMLKGGFYMMVIGGALIFAGLVAGSFISLGVSITIVMAGLAALLAASWRAELKEKQAESWRAAYPSYKY